MCYKSTGRGADRILIRTNKKIYIETGMMKRSEEAERLIKEKGYLQVNLITDRKKDKEILNYSESVHVM